jgi:uncharacterized protein YndB with AHSA1/START domain
VLEAPPEEVFEVVRSPLVVDPNNLPKRAELTIDHSASQSGPDQWGVGSISYGSLGSQKQEVVVTHCDPPHLVAYQVRQDGTTTTHGRAVCTLSPTQNGGTLLDMYSMSTPDDKSLFGWLIQLNYKQRTQHYLDKLVEQFGGEVLNIDN